MSPAPSSTAGSTATVIRAASNPAVASIVTTPWARPRTRPAESTVATVGSALAQVVGTARVSPCGPRVTASSRVVSPGATVAHAGLSMRRMVAAGACDARSHAAASRRSAQSRDMAGNLTLPSSPVLAYPDARSRHLTTTSLLLVEDDEFVRLALTRALNRTGVFAVMPAEHGERALELIVVHSGNEEGRLYFDSGALVHAETRRLRGLAAVNEVVGWPDPRLEIFYRRTARDRTIDQPLQQVLMEAAQLLDERGRGLEPADEVRPVAAQRPDLQEALDERSEERRVGK